MIGEDAVDIYNSFDIENTKDENNKDKEIKLEIIIKRFDRHFIPEENTTYTRYCFFKIQQLIDESIESYYRS